ncbi:MAG: FtsX-like permease family protein, partial [Actinomycetota bacterium]
VPLLTRGRAASWTVSMWRATVRGIVAHRVRMALSVVAVMLGVTFVTGTYVLTDTLDRSYDGLFRATVAKVDLVVQLRGQSGPEGTRERFPDRVARDAAAVPGVRRVHGVVQGYAQFVDRDGDAIRTGGAPTLGISWAQDGRRGPLRLVGTRSRVPVGPDQVAMDVGTAAEHGFAVGDRVRVLLQGPAREFRISGLFTFGNRSDLGAMTFAAFDEPTAQDAVGAPGEVDALNVVRDPGVPSRIVRAGLVTALGPAYEVQTAAEAAAEAGSVVRQILVLLTAVLLAFAAVGVVIAALLVFNTFTIVVAQRARELGLLRVIGASRGQVVTAIVVEGLVVGVVASAAGLALGIGVASSLLWVVRAAGFDVPDGGVVVAGRTVAVALGLGMAASVAAALWPAARAARRSPLEAMVDAAPAHTRGLAGRLAFGLAVLHAGVPCAVIGLDRTSDARRVTGDLAWVGAGALLVLTGVVVLLAAVAGPLAGLLGRVGRRADVAGRLARENTVRNPRRTAATASALVIGLTLVTTVAVFGGSAKASVSNAVDRGIRADVILKAPQFTGFSPEVSARAAQVRGVRAVAPFQFRRVRILGNEETVASADAGGLGSTVDLDLVRGSVARLATDGILVQRDAAREYDVGVGDTMIVQMSRGYYPLRVAGIYRQADFTGGLPISFVVPRSVYAEGFGTDEQDTLVYLRTAGDGAAVAAAVRAALRDDFPNVDVLTRAGYRDDQERAVDRFLAVSVALLLLAEIIAVLGIVNALALSVFERTRELGLLRAVGMSRAQVRRMIRREAVVTAALGALVGIAVGLTWGRLFVAALASQGLTTVAVPWVRLGGFLAVALLAGLAAAWLPARRASRLDVLGAIAEP